eukprot:COSAG06_NODE_1186_length_10343_cov_19.170929_9_plen_105_part_00
MNCVGTLPLLPANGGAIFPPNEGLPQLFLYGRRAPDCLFLYGRRATGDILPRGHLLIRGATAGNQPKRCCGRLLGRSLVSGGRHRAACALGGRPCARLETKPAP